MHVNRLIFKELIKRGYSVKNKTRVWDISDSKLWYLTPELSKGFLKLKKYEPYRKNVVDREIALIKEHARTIASTLPVRRFNLIDLGCGSGLKAETFINSLPKDVLLRYCPVDINADFVERATQRIRGIKSKKVSAIKSFVSDFKDLDNITGLLRTSTYQSNLILLLGETISHYDINDFLFKLSRDMFKGDFIVIGNGIRKGKRLVSIDKYRAPLFNDWFIHIMHGLGFQDNEIRYDARFANNRVEGFYHVLVDKIIIHDGKKVSFKKGDEVVVATQTKYYPNELKKFCSMYFRDVTIILDKSEDYCLTLCKK